MKKLFLLFMFLFIFSLFSWETPIVNEDIKPDPRVVVYIPARLDSTRLPQKLLKVIDGKTVIERTYERAKFIRRAGRVCVITNSSEIAAIIGSDAQLIDKEYINGTERICDAFFNHSDHREEIIVNVQGDEPYLEPSLVDYAIKKFQECESDSNLGAIFLHRDLLSEEAVQPGRVKVVIDQNNRLLYGSRSVIPYGNSPNYYARIGIMVYKANALKEFWQHQDTPLANYEDLHWLKLLEMGYTIKSFEVANTVERSVETYEDDLSVLNEKYSKPRIFLIRSGGFSEHFVRKTNTLWPLRENDLVCRCKRTSFNNLDLFNGRVDYAFFNIEKYFFDLSTLKSTTFTANPSENSIAVVNLSQYNELPKPVFFEKFCEANNFKHVEELDWNLCLYDFEKETGIKYIRGKKGRMVSLGFSALSYLRRNFPDHLIVLVDFTFEGVDVHSWDKEKEYALRLERDGHLIRLLDNPTMTSEERKLMLKKAYAKEVPTPKRRLKNKH